ncbi:MAG: amidohydrolase family protein [Cyclobacteriaceae bacterium]|nr:amidohydrolase family protein [Cyclobacteriaceae bacterium]
MSKLMHCLWISAFLLICSCNQNEVYDIVLSEGTVYDPESGLQEEMNIGIQGDRIAKLSKESLQGRRTISVKGLVVSPGFIDLHVHGTTIMENQFQVHDGVTTALDLEFGATSIQEFIQQRTGHSLVNFGASAAYGLLRMQALNDSVISKNSESSIQVPADLRLDTMAIERAKTLVRKQIENGALGIGVPIGYFPSASRRETYEIYKLAHELKVPIFTHIRMGKALAVQQVLADAMTTGASLHIVHINSSSGEEIDLTLEMIQNARQKGFDITTEVYPYTAGSTDLASAIFQPGWQENLGITYRDLQWVETGERLTEETFNQYRKTGGIVIVHQMQPPWIKTAIQSPFTLIASDGMKYSRLAHPRTAGTFSRVLGKYVRDEQVLTLMEALTKMTLMPAKRLESIAPDMKKRGRIQEGCYADITVFDPAIIIDKATFDEGLKFSEGISFVIVNGMVVLENGNLVDKVFPGRAILSQLP